MMISGPKNSVPTLRGWVAPNGELLKAQKISQEEIDEWNGVSAPAHQPEPVVEAEPEVVEEEVEAAPQVSIPKVPKASTLRQKIRNAIKR